MILKKEFYFVRHGQTDHNARPGKDKGDHPTHIPLNQMGREQAVKIEPIITHLPVQTICHSPMRRVLETKNLIAANLKIPHYEIDELGECSAKVWNEMSRLGMYSSIPSDGEARLFFERVRKGLNQALLLPGPLLIVAHGGVHWATCCLMNIQSHDWAIENCGVVHFSIDGSGKWVAKKIT